MEESEKRLRHVNESQGLHDHQCSNWQREPHPW